MGLFTFTQIDGEIQKHHADRADLTTARLTNVVDLCQMRIARLTNWDQLDFLVRGTLPFTGVAQADKVYDLSTDLPTGYKVKNLYSVRILSSDGRSRRLEAKTRKAFDTLIPEPEYYAVGYPEMYTRVSSISTGSTQVNPALEFWRVPDVAYSLELRLQVWPRYRTDSGKVDGDVSDLEVDDALIALANSYLFNSYGREDKARFHFGIYSSILADAHKLDDTDFEEVMAGVKVSEGGLHNGVYWADPFVRDTF